eukprot:GDKJ01027801.1.p1 GENE.GDKJ01027801.1~~GDKJ01027801.1.p1  ORF type:complete len:884 (-),score=164.36 GDKJ01027801.1:43-2694(-)
MNSIRKLPDHVINKIAAGEVVVRPCSAAKELIENSLDANSTKISIQVIDGGLKQFQISDNGNGIKVEDFPILCERFTTSKLSCVDDLRSLSTFGFRGEALASVSHVSLLTVISRTEKSPCAFTASFANGKMTVEKPKPAAGQVGTILTFNDLFYNMPTRKQVLGTASDEHNRIIDVVQKYSLRYPTVSFTVRKSGKNSSDLRTNGGPQTTTLDVVKLLWGYELVSELQAFRFVSPRISDGSVFVSPVEKLKSIESSSHPSMAAQGERLGVCSIEGLASTPCFPSNKKGCFILFINNRLVDNASIKKSIDSFYSDILPKGSKPWVFLSLTLPAEHLDVNVHPTKREVMMLHEDMIAQLVVSILQTVLEEQMGSRIFKIGDNENGVDERGMKELLIADENLNFNRRSSLDGAEKSRVESSLHTEGFTDSDRDQTSQLFNEEGGDEDAGGEEMERIDAHTRQLFSSNRKLLASASEKKTQLTFHVDSNTNVIQMHNSVVDGTSALALPSSTQQPDCKVNKAIKAARVRGNHPSQRSIFEFSTTPTATNQNEKSSGCWEGDEENKDATAANTSVSANRLVRQRPLLPSSDADCLASVASLLSNYQQSSQPKLLSLLRSSTFVGAVSERHCLLQHGQRLLLVDVLTLASESTHQSILKRVGRLPEVWLDPPLPLRLLVQEGRERRIARRGAEGVVSVDEVFDVLLAGKDLLWEYFSILIEEEGEGGWVVRCLPDALDGGLSFSSLDALPSLFFKVGADVNWECEEQALDTLSRMLTLFAICSLNVSEGDGDAEESDLSKEGFVLDEKSGSLRALDGGSDATQSRSQMRSQSRMAVPDPKKRRMLEDLFNISRSFGSEWFVPQEFANATQRVFKVLTSLDKLYKIFERC